MASRLAFLIRFRITILAVSVVVALGMGIAMLTSGYAKKETKPKLDASLPQNIPSYKQRVRIWIYGDSIRPQIVHAKPGPINLTVENKTILNAELAVERLLPNGAVAPVGSLGISPERARRNQELVVGDGEYQIYERGRPQFKAKLLVSP